MSYPILLEQLRAASTADEVIKTLQEIVDLDPDDGSQYRSQETVDRLDPQRRLRVIIERNKTNDALIDAIGSFLLWFMPQPEQFPTEFRLGQDLCTRNNQIAEFYINTLLPNANSNASIYSVCRGVCRIIYNKTFTFKLLFITPRAEREITNAVLRAFDARSCLWSVAIIRDMCSNRDALRDVFVQRHVLDAILRVFTQNVTATAIECAFAALHNLQVDCTKALDILRSSPSYALSMILNGLPKVSTADGMYFAFTVLANIIKDSMFATTLQTKEVARVLFRARSNRSAWSARAIGPWTRAIDAILGLRIGGSLTSQEVIRMFAEVEDEILGKEATERLALRKCATRVDLLRVIWPDEFIASVNNDRSKVRIFNNSSVLIEKIEYFLHLPENTDREQEEKQQFICDVAQWFDANFFVPDNSNSIAIDSEKLFDFFFHTLLSNSSFHLPKQAADTSSAEIVLRLLDGRMPGYVQQNNAAGAGKSWMAAIEQVLGLFDGSSAETNELGDEKDDDDQDENSIEEYSLRQAFVRRLSLGLSLILKLCSGTTDGHLCADKALFLVDSGRISKLLIKQKEMASNLGFCLRSDKCFTDFVERIISTISENDTIARKTSKSFFDGAPNRDIFFHSLLSDCPCRKCQKKKPNAKKNDKKRHKY